MSQHRHPPLHMRPGHVVHHPTADGSSRTDEELTHADIARERGDDDADNEYVEGRLSGARTSARLAATSGSSAVAASSTATASGTSRFSAVEKTPSRARATGAAGRNTTGGTTHSYIPAIPNELLTLLRTPNFLDTLACQHTAALSQPLTPTVSREGSVSTVSSMAIAPEHLPPSGTSSARTSPAPTIPAKRVSTTVEVIDKAAAARAKKAKHNAKRPRHYQYRQGDVTFAEVLRSTACLMQVHLATVNPFPSPEERTQLIKDQFALALDFHNLEEGTFALSDEEHRMLNEEETNMRGRAKKATTPLICTLGFKRIPRGDVENIDTEDGRFLSPLIAQGVYDAFFSHAAALGCLYQPHFTPFPHTALALILTALEHGIEQYTSGTFDTNQYQHAAIWKTYRKKLVRDGLSYAGAVVEKPGASAVALEIEVSQEEIDAEMAHLAAQELDGFVDSSDVEPEPEWSGDQE
ncbi:hypothetical protein BC628DRAFT_514110 [Trametes gibbosa]|nr:hypothetical protein BC628DRAFT_514110 [Trametes gibbosa]